LGESYRLVSSSPSDGCNTIQLNKPSGSHEVWQQLKVTNFTEKFSQKFLVLLSFDGKCDLVERIANAQHSGARGSR
jgi:hypothetical protein